MSSSNDNAGLSDREAQVARLYVDGLSYKEIARDLGIAPGTVRTHLNAIYRKLEVTNRIALLQTLSAGAPAEPPDAAVAPDARAERPAPAARTPQPALERRQLTVLFVDLVGSTELSTALDAEDMHALLGDYRATVCRELERLGGYAAGFPGDGVVASFGWPSALEDAAERAIRAGLAIAAAVGEMTAPDGRALAARVGIATGMVVVDGRSGGADSLTGATPNLAARLQALAEPGCVLIAAATHELAGRLFEVSPLGEQALKGLSEPVRVYRVDGERPNVSRFAATHDTQLLPMLGRDHELALLQERWSRAQDGEGQAVLLAGEPGIGKSRIAAALVEAVKEDGATILRYQMAQQQADNPLWPVRQQIAFAAQIGADAAPEEQLRLLRVLLQRGGPVRESDVALIADLLDIEADDPLPPMSAERRREQLLEVLVRQLLALAGKAAVLVLFEDLHWIDPTSLDLVERVLASIDDRRVLLLMTTRPDGEPPLPGHAHLTRVTLNRLAKAAVEAMVTARAAGAALDPEVVETILARTDGVPLYVEEMTAAILEAGAAADAVPTSLQDSLMARLDRLGEAKETAQIAAVIGREFDLDLMTPIVGDAGVVDAAIARLVKAELVLKRGQSYVFKHALVQDAAYQSLLRSRRTELHGRIADALLGGSRQRIANEPALLAHHLEHAGRPEAAVDYYVQAANLANNRAANREARRHLERALSLIEALPPGLERDRREVSALSALGRINAAAYGHASSEAADVYRRALALCRASKLGLEEFPIVLGLTVQAAVSGNTHAALDMARRLRSLADGVDDPTLDVQADYALGITLCWRGERAEALRHLEAAIGAYSQDQHARHLALYGQDPAVICRSRAGMIRWWMGEPDEAARQLRAAGDLAMSLGHPFSIGYALTWRAIHALEVGDPDDARRAVDETLSFAEEQGFTIWRAMGLASLSRWVLDFGDPGEAVPAVEHALAALRESGTGAYTGYALALYARALTRTGNAEAGLEQTNEALATLEENGARWCEVEVLRAAACCKAALGDGAGAAALLERALAVAERGQSRMLELRVASDLAELNAGDATRDRVTRKVAAIGGGEGEREVRRARALVNGAA